jgi:hypothetical protein
MPSPRAGELLIRDEHSSDLFCGTQVRLGEPDLPTNPPGAIQAETTGEIATESSPANGRELSHSDQSL